MGECPLNQLLIPSVVVVVVLVHFVEQGQFFSGSSYRIYLLGNPVIWWSNLVFLGLFVLVFCVDAILGQRKKAKLSDVEEEKGNKEGTYQQVARQKEIEKDVLLIYLMVLLIVGIFIFRSVFVLILFSRGREGIGSGKPVP